MIPVLAVLMSLAGPLFWRDLAEDCDAALSTLQRDVEMYAPGVPVFIAQWDCDEANRADGLARPYARLTTASGAPLMLSIFWPAPSDGDAPDEE